MNQIKVHSVNRFQLLPCRFLYSIYQKKERYWQYALHDLI